MVRILFLLVAYLATSGLAAAQHPTSQLATIRSTATVRIAYRSDAAPFSFINEKKEITGYTIDLCKRIAVSIGQQLGLPSIKINWVPVTSQNRFEMIINGKADIECGSSGATL